MIVEHENLTTSDAELENNEKDNKEDNKYLSFIIGEEEYAISIEHVIEIIEMIKITPVPDMNSFTKGVMNLRSKIIPVMDVRLRFSMKEQDYSEKTCIIVVHVENKDVGLIVDTVTEVISIPKKCIEEPSHTYDRPNDQYVLGLAQVDNTVKIVLDIGMLVLFNTIPQTEEVA